MLHRIIVGLWLCLALVLSSSYSGNLRAFILKPEHASSIDSVESIVSSGLPWNIVILGDILEIQLQQQADAGHPLYEKFWNGKETAEYTEFPYQRVINISNIYIYLCKCYPCSQFKVGVLN